MRLLLDTNTVIAALLWNGPPRRLLEAAIDGRVELVTSQHLLDELAAALAYPKFAQRIAQHGTTIAQLVDRYAALVALAPEASISPAVAADPDDDAVLACALAARADLVVSGDHALLNLKHYHGIDIVNAADALVRVRT
jgi:putative PIN family toxin of toxin-antitoxin system